MSTIATGLIVRNTGGRWLVFVTAGAALALAGCQGGLPGEVETASRAVINGWAERDFPSNSPPAVALYHGAMRPCSASMITWNGWVLTAAHCVVVNKDDLGSALKPLSVFKATPPKAISPGREPPPNAVPAQYVAKHPSLDIALLFFPGLLNAEHTSWNKMTTTLYVGSPAELSGKFFDIWGYGRSQMGEPTGLVEDGTSGAGTLRWGVVQHVASTATHLTHRSANVGGTYQETWRGDSGGPTLLPNIVRWEGTVGKRISAQTQVSVHSTSNQQGDLTAADVLVSAALPWINGQLGYHFFVKRFDLWDSRDGYIDVQGGGTAPGTPVFLAPHTDAPQQRWQYTTSSELRNTLGNCLDVQNNNPSPGTPVWTFPCNNTSAQRWTFHVNNQIKNANGLCLTGNSFASNSGLYMQPCSEQNTLQRWTFSASP